MSPRAALVALAALSGCLVTHVDGDPSPSPRPQLGEAHACRVELYCGGVLAQTFERRACSDDTDRLENEVAYACYVANGQACGGFCYAECTAAPSPCFFFDDGEP
ncbi:MAG: hypothetical protein KIT31_37300 [Deltaproteobacteria bacterium]|nr:hypothetical protein [Deltaproteobacteria bacterium]